MITVTKCPACNGTSFSPYITTTDFTVTRQQFSLVRCVDCNLLATSPRPADSDLGTYYQSDDYISHTSRANGLTNSLYLLARKFTLSGKLEMINQLRTRGKILDVGCGTGDFLAHCKKDGWDVQGIEPGGPARELAQQKKIPVIDNIEQAAGPYDVITLWHVLEHVPDPSITLTQLTSLLAQSGTLVIAVPNHDSYDGAKYKQYWAGYDVPRHLWHFDKRNMERLLHKNGFRLKNVKPMWLDSFYVSLLSERYKDRGLAGYIRAFITGLWSNYKASRTGEFSSLIYIATK